MDRKKTKRKIYLALVVVMIPIWLLAQTSHYKLRGHMQQQHHVAGQVYLVYEWEDQTMIDSAALDKGVFEFKGSISHPLRAILVMDHQGVGLHKLHQWDADMRALYLEQGDVVLSITDSISKAVIVHPSQLNKEYEQLQSQLRPVGNKLLHFYKKTYDAGLQTLTTAMQQEYGALISKQQAILKAFIHKHPQSWVAIDALQEYIRNDPNAMVTTLEQLFNKLANKLKESRKGSVLRSYIDRIRTVNIGSVAPDFSQNDPAGKSISLSSFKGQYVLLDFWASWCIPCRRDNPHLVAAYQQYKDKNFTILGVSLDGPNGKEAWLRAIKSDGLTWYHVSDLRSWENQAAQLYKVRSIPKSFLIDPAGKIIAKDLRGVDLIAKLRDLERSGHLARPCKLE